VPLLGVNPAEESLDSPYDRRSEVYRHLAFEHVREQPPDPQQRRQQPLWTVPNALTFLRLVLVPVLVLVWYSASPSAPLAAAAVFVTASVTDWFDGYIARRVRCVVAWCQRCCWAGLGGGTGAWQVRGRCTVVTAAAVLAAQACTHPAGWVGGGLGQPRINTPAS
jgi:hypothetical protein